MTSSVSKESTSWKDKRTSAAAAAAANMCVSGQHAEVTGVRDQ